MNSRSYILDSNNIYMIYDQMPSWVGRHQRDPRIMDISNDGGQSFRRIDIPGDSTKRLGMVRMFNERIGFVASDDYLTVTKDGWETFSQFEIKNQFVFFEGYVPEGYFLDSNRYAIPKMTNKSGYDIVVFSLKKGEWGIYFDDELDDDSEYNPVIDGIFISEDSNIGYETGFIKDTTFNSSYDVIFKTYDKGRSWNPIFQGDYPINWSLSSIAFKDNFNGIALGFNKWLYTSDGGETCEYGHSNSKFSLSLVENISFSDTIPIVASGNIL